MSIASHIHSTPRGYTILYRPEATNYCPGCTKTNWYVGRQVAECAFCGTVLPLRDGFSASSWQMPQIQAA